MRKSRIITGVGLAAAALLTLTACNSGTPGRLAIRRAARAADAAGTWFEVATDVTLDGSPTFDAITDRGTVKVGVKEDQPGLGYLDPTTGERTGFDIDIARWIAASLGYDEDKIEFTAIPSANREQAIVNGDIDYYVGTYSITDERKEQISFAGPYFVTGQGLLVAARQRHQRAATTSRGKNVCSATGSTSIQRIKDEHPEADDDRVRHVLAVRRAAQERSGGCRHDRRVDPHRLRRPGSRQPQGRRRRVQRGALRRRPREGRHRACRSSSTRCSPMAATSGRRSSTRTSALPESRASSRRSTRSADAAGGGARVERVPPPSEMRRMPR